MDSLFRGDDRYETIFQEINRRTQRGIYMLTEKEVCERAEYCYLICLQLNWMYANESIRPEKYLEQIRKSSLGLAEDDFIVMSLEEGLKTGLEDCGVNNLILMYESFVHAFCEVLQIEIEDLRDSIPRELLQKLASEMGAKLSAEG